VHIEACVVAEAQQPGHDSLVFFCLCLRLFDDPLPPSKYPDS
jgi:hypothetical protein